MSFQPANAAFHALNRAARPTETLGGFFAWNLRRPKPWTNIRLVFVTANLSTDEDKGLSEARHMVAKRLSNERLRRDNKHWSYDANTHVALRQLYDLMKEFAEASACNQAAMEGAA